MPESPSIPVKARKEESRLPVIAVGAVVAFVVVANAAIDPLVGAVALFGLIGVLVISMRPAFAVTLLLGSFLVTYPWWLQGRGVLTLNNALGGFLSVLLAYRLYRNGDWKYLRSRELYLLIAIAAVFLFSRFLHRPDEHTMELVSDLVEDELDPARTIVNRLVFFTFLVYFVRTPAESRMVFLLAVALMVASGFAGIVQVLSGGGFAGYRARSGFFIYSAGNPNRLALVAIIAIVTLYYAIQQLRHWLVTLVLGGIIMVEVLAVFMTGSRSGAVALVFGFAILFFDSGISVRKILVGGLAGLLAAILILRVAPEESLQRISNVPGTESADSDLGAGSAQRRSYTAGLALEFAESSPLIGVGLGNWEITRYLSDPVHNITPPHSSPLMALAEGGIVTFTLYVILLVHTLRTLHRCASALSGPEHRGWLQWMTKSLYAGFLVFLALSLVGDLWMHPLLYWFVGLAVTLPRVIFEPEPAAETETSPTMVAEVVA